MTAEKRTGKLSQEEKYLVVGMFLHGVEIGEIKRRLNRDRTSSQVDNYIAKFVDLKAPEEPLEGREFTGLTKTIPTQIKYDKPAVLSKMALAGIHGEDANRLLEKALANFQERGQKFVETKDLYNEVMRGIGARELMVREGNGGEKGVVVMTEAAANMGQNIRDHVKQHQPDYVYHVRSPNGKK